ncbi:MAG: hypothetical protein ACOC4C_01100 [Fibrobacterota bacterium]
MRLFSVFCIALMVSSALLHGQDKGDLVIGVNVMVGIRYDDIRMCVASPAGTPGGPVADVMLDLRYDFDENTAVSFNLPVMRPILFAVAFDMLQFEPQFTFEQRFNINDDLDFVFGPGLGVSLHYGPDYKTAKDADNPEDFFAIGPNITSLFGINFNNESKLTRTIGLKAFYIPLFSSDYRNGTILGAALEGHFGFHAFD